MLLSCTSVTAERPDADPCQRPPPGSVIPEPSELRSVAGVLKLELTIRNTPAQDGATHYCYLTPQGAVAPTLRLHPGDLLILRLKNALRAADAQAAGGVAASPVASAAGWTPAKRVNKPLCKAQPVATADPCSSGAMTAVSTNLHFHGLTVPPVCHQDDVLKTAIQPADAPFEYRFQIPLDESPGLYWYHPHIHGFSAQQVSGGASGAIIIEGIERATPRLAGMPERVLVIRDQELVNPHAPPSTNEPVVPKMLNDRDGDAANNGSGFGKPARDLSVNFVPVPYPDYPPAQLTMKPGVRELWRVLNASAVTYLNLAVIYRRAPQPLGIVAIDGAPISGEGSPGPDMISVDHVGVPPGARAEFIVEAPPPGSRALLVTRTVDTGQGGENDPNRALATIFAAEDAPQPRSVLPAHPKPLPAPGRPWLGDVTPVRVRKLYFSEKLDDPANPNSATTFYITEAGHAPKVFDPAATTPDIVVRQGDVEDWIIENHSNELHDFHAHQLHFLLLDWSGTPVNETFLRDTVNVPYFNGRALQYPSVRVRMDFRDPNTVGTFVFHCHLLEHEDGGMMGTIRVLAQSESANVRFGD